MTPRSRSVPTRGGNGSRTMTLVRNCLVVNFLRETKTISPCKRCSGLAYADDDPSFDVLNSVYPQSSSTTTPSSDDDSSPYTSWTPSEPEGPPAKLSGTLSSTSSFPLSTTCKCKPMDGPALFAEFVTSNCNSYWNPSLVSSVASLSYKGFILPSTVLAIGTEYAYEVIRSAYSRRIIRAPEGYLISSLGDIQLIEMSLVYQTKFTPLTEAICKCIHDFNGKQPAIFIDDICEYLKREYTQIMPPSEDMVRKSLRILEKHGKVKYSDENGYSMYKPEEDIPFIDSKGPAILTADEVISRLHGSPTSSSESAYYGSNGVQADLPNLTTPTFLNTISWEFDSCMDHDASSDQTSLRRSASFRLKSDPNDSDRRPIFTRSKSLRMVHRDRQKCSTLDSQDVVETRGEAGKKTSLFAKIFSRLSTGTNVASKSKTTYPSLAEILKRSRETETEPLETESRATQTSIKANLSGTLGRRSNRNVCKSCSCKNRPQECCFSGKCRTNETYSRCGCSGKWPANRTNRQEYCALIPSYTATSIGPFDPSCEKCYKILSSSASFGCCPLGPGAIQCPEAKNMVSPAIAYNQMNCVRSPVSDRVCHDFGPPNISAPFCDRKQTNDNLIAMDKFKSTATVEANTEQRTNGLGKYSYYGFIPERSPPLLDKPTIASERLNYNLESNERPKLLTSEKSAISAGHSVVAKEEGRNSAVKQGMNRPSVKTEIGSQLEDSLRPTSSDERRAKLTIGNSMNIKIEIDSSIRNSKQSNGEKFATSESGQNSVDDNLPDDNVDTYNRIKCSTSSNLMNKIASSSYYQPSSGATTVTTNVTSTASTVNICTVTRTTSSMSSPSNCPSSMSPPSSTSCSWQRGSSSLSCDEIGEESASINDIRRKVAQAKAAFFSSPEPPMIDSSVGK